MSADLTGLDKPVSVKDALSQLSRSDNDVIAIAETDHYSKGNIEIETMTIQETRAAHPDAKIALVLEQAPHAIFDGKEWGVSQQDVDNYMRTGQPPEKADWEDRFGDIVKSAKENNLAVFLVDDTQSREKNVQNILAGHVETEEEQKADIETRNKVMAHRTSGIMKGENYEYHTYQNIPPGGFDKIISINGAAHSEQRHDLNEAIAEATGRNVAVVELHDKNSLHEVTIRPSSYTFSSSLPPADTPDVSININQSEAFRISDVASRQTDLVKLAHDRKDDKTKRALDSFARDMGEEIERNPILSQGNLARDIDALSCQHVNQPDVLDQRIKERFETAARSSPEELFEYQKAMEKSIGQNHDLRTTLTSHFDAQRTTKLISDLGDIAREAKDPKLVEGLNNVGKTLTHDTQFYGIQLRGDIAALYKENGANEQVFESKAKECVNHAVQEEPYQVERYGEALENAVRQSREVTKQLAQHGITGVAHADDHTTGTLSSPVINTPLPAQPSPGMPLPK